MGIDVPERRISNISRLNKPIILSLAAIAAIGVAVAKKIFSTFEPAIDNKPALVDKLSNTPNREPPELPKFDAEKYSPPSQAVVVDRSLPNPQAETIIYIPDHHVDPRFPDAFNESAIQSQREMYALLKDLVEKFKRIAIVYEGAPADFDLFKLAAQAKLLPDEELQKTGSFGHIFRILNEENPVKRMKMADDLIGKAPVPAVALLSAAIPEKAELVGTFSGTDPMQDEQDLFYADDIFKNPGAYSCGQGSKLTLAEAQQKFKKGVRRPEIVDCYCGFWNTVRTLMERFAHSRGTVAPEAEVQKAIDYQGKALKVIVAGSNHVARSLEVFRERRINYAVICPKSSEDTCRTALSKPSFPQPPPDNRQGTCQNWVEMQMLKFLEEDLD